MLKIYLHNSRARMIKICVLVAGLLFLAGCSEEPLKKEIAPDFTLELFEGGKFEFGAHKGKPILINFLASWCIPCREEIAARCQMQGAERVAVVCYRKRSATKQVAP